MNVLEKIAWGAGRLLLGTAGKAILTSRDAKKKTHEQST